MTTLLVLVGLPGSGKSTAAREWVDVDPSHRARVSRDDLRMMMHGRLEWEQTWQEDQVTAAQGAGARTQIRVVDTPVGECIARDAGRPPGRRVGADVIRRLAQAAEWPTSEQATV